MHYLGVIPGAVTAFAVINDHSGAVQSVLDRALVDAERLNLHPLDNTMTTAVSASDLLKFLAIVEHAPEVVDFDAL